MKFYIKEYINLHRFYANLRVILGVSDVIKYYHLIFLHFDFTIGFLGPKISNFRLIPPFHQIKIDKKNQKFKNGCHH